MYGHCDNGLPEISMNRNTHSTLQQKMPALLRSTVLGLTALAIATALWLPCIHFLFRKPTVEFYQLGDMSPKARQLAARHLQLWTEPELRQLELNKLRSSNAEWDFMGRSFLVWSLANMGMREPHKKDQYLPIMDQIIDETVKMEQHNGMYAFLMPYARSRPYVAKPDRSLFIDSEIALMMGARRMLQEEPKYRQPMTERLDEIEKRMRASPILAVESYPDECWTFDHAVALAAFKLEDRLDGTDHSALCHQWLAIAKQMLIDKTTGILVSSYDLKGVPMDGPEGSSIWMVAHCLQVVDESFARDQYQRARKELGRVTCGFGYGREWPSSWKGTRDIDAGAVIPVLEISAGSSGMAFVAASTFHDWEFLQALATTLDMAAFPTLKEGRLKYCASNQVGDAAMLYATVLGPLWERTSKP